ncbi:hypothetical protein CTA2_4857 [Colletotrichum tanaceti]|uniref:Inner kinetochore subunit AME1 domain-containing protein n=1 Tax=Colletotrichum tanaceti TaxID=1306861 RepID=A0A4U6XQV9_9PEZI|nr:hypothetical protein CTA2_4857 [Colletotrichum tanaceti]TKW58263.1 hypothetical protein CTA1_12128 [Colletotrichum tanaceti]
MTSRAERMQQRMRAKRRKLESDTVQPARPATSDANLSTRQSVGKADPYQLQEGVSTEPTRTVVEQPATSPKPVIEAYDPNSIESLPPSRPVALAPPISPVSKRVTTEHTEVEESPLDAPGSGRRRTVTTSSAVASSAKLQQALSPGENETEPIPISSPLERKARRNTNNTRRSTLSSRGSREPAASEDGGLNEPSPGRDNRVLERTISPELSYHIDAALAEPTEPVDEPPPVPIFRPRLAQGLETEPVVEGEPEPEPEPEHDESVAEEVNANEAAERLGRKRPRRSPRRPSPEPDSTNVDEEQEEPLPKRRRKQSQKSPTKQKQGRPKASSKAKHSPTKRKKKQGADGTEESITIPIQRFTKRVPVAEGNDDDPDVLNLDIPFAARGGVNTVDVLTQMCDEIIEASLDTLKEGVRNATDKATKREHQVQFRALEAYREELRIRLLQHTILLDTLHSLRKRVRSVQKERIALRDEIMQIRAEREQVALRKDAIRIKHEKATQEALSQLNLSSQMHDIDLAVERGRAASELDPAEKKTAELANLEILISRITDQACTQSGAGGTLKQIKDFNAFLERAAVALESR